MNEWYWLKKGKIVHAYSVWLKQLIYKFRENVFINYFNASGYSL